MPRRLPSSHEVQFEATIKVVDHFEETADDGTVTQRDRDRFTNRVSLVFADGRTATLGEKGEER